MASKDTKTKIVYRPETTSKHTGYITELSEGSVITPIFLTSTYEFNSAQHGEKSFKTVLAGKGLSDLIYARINHPAAQILEERLAKIEPQGVEAAVFNSGMAAIATSIRTACPVGKVIAYSSPLYGGTYCYLHTYLKKSGYKLCKLSKNPKRANAQLQRLGKSLGIVLLETPANPTLQMVDIHDICHAAKQANPRCYTMLDNTFMGIFQNGFNISDQLDIILYSGTKFLSGHSNVLCGVVICRKTSEGVLNRIKMLRIMEGNILPAYQSSQMLDHISTYEIRMRTQAANAELIAERLDGLKNKKLTKVLHPCLLRDDDRKLYAKQCSGGSSIICMWFKSKRNAFSFLNNLRKERIIQLAVSLGGVESLACHPASTTHSELSKKELAALDITNGLVRLSVGLENPDDLIRIITKALRNI